MIVGRLVVASRAPRRGSTDAADASSSSPSSVERVEHAGEAWLRAILERGALQGQHVLHCTFGSSSTNRPTPIVAAFGVVIGSGTSHDHVLGDLALAGQPPALVELLGSETWR